MPSNPERKRIEFEGKGGALHEPTPEDREAWRILFTRQLELIRELYAQGKISRRFMDGIEALGLTQDFPDYQKLNQYLEAFGWKLDETNVVYMNKHEWFGAFEKGIFPTTWYIRGL